MGMTRSHGVLLLAAAAEGLVPPIRSSLIFVDVIFVVGISVGLSLPGRLPVGDGVR